MNFCNYFNQFIKEIDPKETFQFSFKKKNKSTAYFNINNFAEEKYIGKERFTRILNILGVKVGF